MNKKKATFRLIEAELYAYPKTKEELEQMREDILSMQAVAHEGVRVNASGVSDTTAKKAVKLTSLALMETARRVEAIEYVYDKLDEERKKLVRLKYWEGNLTNQGIAREMNIDLATFYRWRKGIVEAIALRLGWEI